MQDPSSSQGPNGKKKKHRAGKKRRNRRQSFAASASEIGVAGMDNGRPSLLDAPNPHSAARDSFYRLGKGPTSSTSLESEALHRSVNRRNGQKLQC